MSNTTLDSKDLANLEEIESGEIIKGQAKDDGYLACKYAGEIEIIYQMIEKAGMRKRIAIETRIAPLNSDVLVIGNKGQSYFSLPDDTWYFRTGENIKKGNRIVGFQVTSEWVAVDIEELKFDGE